MIPPRIQKRFLFQNVVVTGNSEGKKEKQEQDETFPDRGRTLRFTRTCICYSLHIK